MSSRSFGSLWVSIALVCGLPQAAAALDPDEAAAGRRADFKVVIWYARADPLATFHYQVYDLRKREYTPAVDAWMRSVQAKYPTYTAFIREVDLGVEEGATDALKVGSVIKRELTVAAALSGVVLGAPISTRSRPSESREAFRPVINRPIGASTNDRNYLRPSPAPFPVPMPYPRPHP